MGGVLMRATIGDIIGDWGEGCGAVNGSSDMNGPRLDGSSFGGGVNLDEWGK